jgi:hypothetical protein
MTSDVLELPVAFADAQAADLELHLGLPPQPALAMCVVEQDGWTAELRILGASHQVLIRRGGRTLCSETVACHLPHSSAGLAPLPGRHRSGGHYEFRSDVLRLEPAAFRLAVEDLLHHHGEDHSGRVLCARFPGDALGATALRLDPHDAEEPTSISWRTWHTYPRTAEVVATWSRAAVAVGSSPRRT